MTTIDHHSPLDDHHSSDLRAGHSSRSAQGGEGGHPAGGDVSTSYFCYSCYCRPLQALMAEVERPHHEDPEVPGMSGIKKFFIGLLVL